MTHVELIQKFNLDLGDWESRPLASYLHSVTLGRPPLRETTSFKKLCQQTTPLRRSLSTMFSILAGSTQGAGIFAEMGNGPERFIHTTPEGQNSFFRTEGFHSPQVSGRWLQGTDRWYRTHALLHKINPFLLSMCWRCGDPVGTLKHIFWACGSLCAFWDDVTDQIKSSLG